MEAGVPDAEDCSRDEREDYHGDDPFEVYAVAHVHAARVGCGGGKKETFERFERRVQFLVFAALLEIGLDAI